MKQTTQHQIKKKKITREKNTGKRDKVIIDYTIQDSTHSLTTSSHWTQHVASDCCRFMIVRCFLFIYLFYVCLSRSVCSIEEEDRIIQVNQEAVFQLFLLLESKHVPSTSRELGPWKRRGFLKFLLQETKQPPSSSTWGLGPSSFCLFFFFLNTFLP